ncbi:hypothetical protein HDU67_005109 [Dinochytrium kinnereticum]|nr:hypothetical protein HDU67_005109 [Dinochytrium kinnereticum]
MARLHLAQSQQAAAAAAHMRAAHAVVYAGNGVGGGGAGHAPPHVALHPSMAGSGYGHPDYGHLTAFNPWMRPYGPPYLSPSPSSPMYTSHMVAAAFGRAGPPSFFPPIPPSQHFYNHHHPYLPSSAFPPLSTVQVPPPSAGNRRSSNTSSSAFHGSPSPCPRQESPTSVESSQSQQDSTATASSASSPTLTNHSTPATAASGSTSCGLAKDGMAQASSSSSSSSSLIKALLDAASGTASTGLGVGKAQNGFSDAGTNQHDHEGSDSEKHLPLHNGRDESAGAVGDGKNRGGEADLHPSDEERNVVGSQPQAGASVSTLDGENAPTPLLEDGKKDNDAPVTRAYRDPVRRVALSATYPTADTQVDDLIGQRTADGCSVDVNDDEDEAIARAKIAAAALGPIDQLLLMSEGSWQRTKSSSALQEDAHLALMARRNLALRSLLGALESAPLDDSEAAQHVLSTSRPSEFFTSATTVVPTSSGNFDSELGSPDDTSVPTTIGQNVLTPPSASLPRDPNEGMTGGGIPPFLSQLQDANSVWGSEAVEDASPHQFGKQQLEPELLNSGSSLMFGSDTASSCLSEKQSMTTANLLEEAMDYSRASVADSMASATMSLAPEDAMWIAAANHAAFSGNGVDPIGVFRGGRQTLRAGRMYPPAHSAHRQAVQRVPRKQISLHNFSQQQMLRSPPQHISPLQMPTPLRQRSNQHASFAPSPLASPTFAVKAGKEQNDVVEDMAPDTNQKRLCEGADQRKDKESGDKEGENREAIENMDEMKDLEVSPLPFLSPYPSRRPGRVVHIDAGKGFSAPSSPHFFDAHPTPNSDARRKQPQTPMDAYPYHPSAAAVMAFGTGGPGSIASGMLTPQEAFFHHQQAYAWMAAAAAAAASGEGSPLFGGDGSPTSPFFPPFGYGGATSPSFGGRYPGAHGTIDPSHISDHTASVEDRKNVIASSVTSPSPVLPHPFWASGAGAHSPMWGGGGQQQQNRFSTGYPTPASVDATLQLAKKASWQMPRRVSMGSDASNGDVSGSLPSPLTSAVSSPGVDASPTTRGGASTSGSGVKAEELDSVAAFNALERNSKMPQDKQRFEVRATGPVRSGSKLRACPRAIPAFYAAGGIFSAPPPLATTATAAASDTSKRYGASLDVAAMEASPLTPITPPACRKRMHPRASPLVSETEKIAAISRRSSTVSVNSAAGMDTGGDFGRGLKSITPSLSSAPGSPVLEEESGGGSGRTYVCNIAGCGKTFSRPYSLKTHLVSHSGGVHGSKLPLTCGACKSVIKEMAALTNHLQTCPSLRVKDENNGASRKPTVKKSSASAKNIEGNVSNKPSSLDLDTMLMQGSPTLDQSTDSNGFGREGPLRGRVMHHRATRASAMEAALVTGYLAGSGKGIMGQQGFALPPSPLSLGEDSKS